MADILCFLANANAAMYVTVYKNKGQSLKTDILRERPKRFYGQKTPIGLMSNLDA